MPLRTWDKTTFLVMELVPGETLADRFARVPIRSEEALPLFQQIAEALEAAHAAGVIHRDLKPANIKVTPEGKTKVLDFGLAKAFADDNPATDLSHSPTLTRDATRAGVIMGTASYMSPEQARGKTVDKRTDIWAFGCVLFEALAGRKAFDGDSVTDVLANVIHKEAPWDALPAATPWRVQDVLRRCLSKDAGLRLHDIADARIELGEDTTPPETGEPAPSSRRGLLVGGLVGLVIGLGLTIAFWSPESTVTGQPQRFVITPPREDPPLELSDPIISLDGDTVVYLGENDAGRRLYLREIGELDSRPLPGTEGAMSPFFSPDGLWVGFFAGDKLKRVSVRGGAPIEICEAYIGGPGGEWAPDGTIWFSPNWISGLVKVPAEGGEPTEVTTPDGEREEVGHWWPEFLPDGRTVLFTIWTNEGSLSKSRSAALDTESGAWRHLFQGAQARYAASGDIVYYTSGIYQVAPFDLSRLEVTGPAVPVLENTKTPGVTGSVGRYYAVSDAGALVTIPGRAYYRRSALAWLGRDGKVERLPFDSAAIREFRISPEGRRVAVARLDEGSLDIWIYDLERGTQEKLPRESNAFSPLWSPDGSRLIFSSSRRGLFDVVSKPIDVFGTEETILGSDKDEGAAALSRDGRWLAFIDYAVETGEDIWLAELGTTSSPIPAIKTPFDDSNPSFSRDGVWLAYDSPVSGRSEVYAQPVLGGGARVRISPDGGNNPLWSPTASELFYVLGDTLMVVSYRLDGGKLLAESPRPLVDMPRQHLTSIETVGQGVVGYDISPDGERFLIMIDTGEDPSPTEIRITLNWFEELKRLTGAN